MRPRSFLLFPLLLLLAACDTLPKKYYHVSVMNLNGDLIAAWTAKGGVYRTWDGLYTMNAVERYSAEPAQKFTYPLGWRVHVGGPNVLIYRVEEPEWLKQQDLIAVADRAEQKAGVR